MTQSLWLDEPYTARPPLQGRAEADVCVIGAGMAGASAALALSGQGLRVVVLEAEQAAARASGRNAGFVITSLAEPYADFAAARGRKLAKDVFSLNVQNRDRVKALVREHGIACGLEATGAWSAALEPREADALQRSAALLRSDGFDAAWLDAKEAEEVLHLRGAHGALHRPGDGQIHPARFTRGLLDAAERRGARVHEGSPVRVLERYGAAWAVQGPGFLVEAPRVLLATNARIPELAPWFADKLFPVRAQALATEVVPGMRLPGPVYADWGYEYWRLHEGRLLLGGMRPVARAEEVGHAEELNARVQAALERFAQEHLPPAASRARITHRWAGVMDFSADGLPFVGEVPGMPGVLAAAGFTGHGFGYATVSAEMLAAQVLQGQDQAPPWLRMGRSIDPRLRPA